MPTTSTSLDSPTPSLQWDLTTPTPTSPVSPITRWRVQCRPVRRRIAPRQGVVRAGRVQAQAAQVRHHARAVAGWHGRTSWSAQRLTICRRAEARLLALATYLLTYLLTYSLPPSSKAKPKPAYRPLSHSTPPPTPNPPLALSPSLPLAPHIAHTPLSTGPSIGPLRRTAATLPIAATPFAGNYAAGEEGRLQYLAQRAIWDRDLRLQTKRIQAESKEEATAVRPGVNLAASGVSSSLSVGVAAEGARVLDPQPARSIVGPDARYHTPRVDGAASTVAATRHGLWPWPATLLSRRRFARTQRLRNGEVLAAAQVAQRKAVTARATASGPPINSTAAVECAGGDSFSSDSSKLGT